MANTINKPIVGTREEVEDTKIKKTRRFLFWETEWWERVNTTHIGNDLMIKIDRPIARLFINDKEITLPTLTIGE